MAIGTEIFSLKGKTALVTGATGYLGQSIVRGLAEAGAHVVINGRSDERTSELVDTLKTDSLSVESAVFDIRNAHEVDGFLSAYKGSLDILVNNAYSGGSGSIECSSGESYADSFDISLVTAHNLLKKLLPLLNESDSASVINIASMYGIVSPDQRIYDSSEIVNPPFYGASKAALIQWTRYAACEFGAKGIRFNSISPGPFPSLEVQESAPEFVNRLEEKVPMGRIGLSKELKGPVLFLASNASSYVNGANIVVDGGWTCW